MATTLPQQPSSLDIEALRLLAETTAELTVRRMSDETYLPLMQRIEQIGAESAGIKAEIFGRNGTDGLIRQFASFRKWVYKKFEEVTKASNTEVGSSDKFRERLIGIWIGIAGSCGVVAFMAEFYFRALRKG